MRTETIATRNLREYMERNKTYPTREDIMNIVGMLPLYLKDTTEQFELVYEDTTTKKTKRPYKKRNTRKNTKRVLNKTVKATEKKTETKKNVNSNVTPKMVLDEVIKLQKKLNKSNITMNDIKAANIPIDIAIEKYGSWKEIKNLLNSNNNGEELINLTKKLGSIPTMEDVKKNNIDISELLTKYGSWKEIKKQLNLEKYYEEKVKTDILALKDKLGKMPSVRECTDAKIDVGYLIRKYNGWKNIKF